MIYFVVGAGKTKIGKTSAIGVRLTDLQCGSPVPLKLVGTIETMDDKGFERLLHDRYANRWSHGEWYDGEFTKADVAEVDGWIKTTTRYKVASGHEDNPLSWRELDNIVALIEKGVARVPVPVV